MNPARCSDCLARVRWELTHPGRKRIMLDHNPHPAGNVRLVGIDDVDELQHELEPALFSVSDITRAPIGSAVSLNVFECTAARKAGWELYTVHPATCPARQPQR